MTDESFFNPILLKTAAPSQMELDRPGNWIELELQIFGARIIETNGEFVYKWWQYDNVAVSYLALITWYTSDDPEPTGWVRACGQRRRPDGDPTKEWVDPTAPV